MDIKELFFKQFGETTDKEYIVYGRAELAGNHTDHQHGLVIAAAIDLPMRAAARANGTDTINVFSEGYGMISVKLDVLHPLNREKNTTAALIRGMASKYRAVSGFDAYVVSEVPKGSGLSSSAAFEVLIGRIIEDLFDCKNRPHHIGNACPVCRKRIFRQALRTYGPDGMLLRRDNQDRFQQPHTAGGKNRI